MNAISKMTQSQFLTLVANRAGAQTDVQLSRMLDVRPPAISKLRHDSVPIGATIIIRIHELIDMPIREIKARLGMPCLPSRAKTPWGKR